MNHGGPPAQHQQRGHHHHHGHDGHHGHSQTADHHRARPKPPPPPHHSSQQQQQQPQQKTAQHPPPPNYHSYKVLIDPMIHRVPEKQIRYDGDIVPGNPHHMAPKPTDPRKKPLPSLWRRLEDLDLPVPRMIIDKNYVGEPPKIEVTMDNLNDNIDKQFLSNRIEKFGEWVTLEIDYHPVSKKHLGLARIVFKQTAGAKECVTALHGKSIMGKLVNCYLDPRFMMAKKMFDDLTTEKKPSPEPEIEEEKELPVEEDVPNNDDHHGAELDVGDEYDARWRDHGDNKWNDHYEEDRYHDRRGSRHRYSRDGDYDDDRDRDSRDRRRDRPSRWDSDDRDRDSRWSRGGRDSRDSHRKERRQSRWDRDNRNSRDQDSRDYDSRDNHRGYNDHDRDNRDRDGRNPDFWAEAAAKFASSTGGAEFHDEESNHATEEVATGQADTAQANNDNHEMDLDTRLQMLMKNKTGNIPAFLMASESSDEEPAKAPAPVHEGPLSRAPSPFLSHDQYMASYNTTLAHDNPVTVSGRNSGAAGDARMSLSPLSEGGDLAELPAAGQYQPFPGQPGYWQGYYGASQGQEYFAGADQYGGHQWASYDQYHQYSQYAEEQERKEKAKKKFAGKNPLRVIIDNVLKIVETELKQILKKDINKRVCETYAFLLFDNWWTEQETRYKMKMIREINKNKKSEPTPAIIPDSYKERLPPLPVIPKPEDLSSLIDKRRANLDSSKGAMGGSLGFGFKIAKIAPTRKPRSPSPKHSSRDRREKDKRRSKDKSKSPKKKRDKSREREKSREKEREKEKVKGEEKTSKVPTSKSVFKEIYSDSDESDKESESSESSSEVESSDDDDSQTSDAESESGSSKISSKSVSRSSSASKSPSRSGSSKPVSPSPPPVTKSRSPSPSPPAAIVSPPPSTSAPTAVSPRRSALAKKVDSSTDSAGEDDTVKKEADDNLEMPTTPVRVKHVTASPPHINDHCYASMVDHCYARRSEDTVQLSDTDSDIVEVGGGGGGGDHDYTTPRTPPKATPKAVQAVKPKILQKKQPAPRPTLPSKPVKWKPRDNIAKFGIIYKFLTDGVDAEDIMYLKKSYEMMLNQGLTEPNLAWINDTHWVDHPITNIPDPPQKRRKMDDYSKPHKTGSARTEGYYKMDPREKARTKYHFHRAGVDAFNVAKLGTKEQQKPQKAVTLSREARNETRRLMNILGDDAMDSNLLQMNQLKFRRKAMRFGKSAIHDWGLFAMENIGADEMVIEYVGDVIRPVLADDREKRYEKQGIGSSYLFRIDLDYVVDATKCGNLARFINHSCEPNCYAKVIKIDGSSKIVIYSKQPIAIGEEITYDYKFPIEDEKIRCLCGSKSCRKYLN